MRPPRISTLLASGIALVLLGLLWYGFAPPSLGGSTSYVVTDGISMEPRFHTGDLALVRAQSSYRVGEVVAYRNLQLHTIVLHRIVGRAGDRYVFKGDNNNFIDFEHPARGQLIGALWIHLPGVGKDLQSLRSPELIGVLIAAGVLMLLGAAFAKRRRRRGRERRAQTPRPRLERDGGRLLALTAGALLALTPFLVLALLAFTRPTSALLPASVPYHQSGRLSYSAQASPGPAYASGRVQTGDPIFTRVLRTVDFAFHYRLAAGAPQSLAGRATLSAVVASTSGWQTTIPLGATSYFRGDSATVSGALELGPLESLLRSVEATTAVSGTYTLTVQPHITIGGSLQQLPLKTAFAPGVAFSLNRDELRPNLPAAGSTLASSASFFVHSAGGTASGRSYQAERLSLRFATLTVAAARTISIVAILLIAAAAALALLALARPRRRSEADAIRARLGAQIVPVARVWQQPGVAVIDVEDFESLLRIAEHYERSILSEITEYGEAFWVTDESGQFRYVAEQIAEPVPDHEQFAEEIHAGALGEQERVRSAWEKPARGWLGPDTLTDYRGLT